MIIDKVGDSQDFLDIEIGIFNGAQLVVIEVQERVAPEPATKSVGAQVLITKYSYPIHSLVVQLFIDFWPMVDNLTEVQESRRVIFREDEALAAYLC